MVSKEQNVCPQNPVFALDDALLCDVHEKDFDFGFGFGSSDPEDQILNEKDPPFPRFEQDLSWEEDELSSLLSKEKNTHLGLGDLIGDESLMGLRKESVDWMIRVSTHYGFVALTTILAVNYFDRFLLSPSFQRDKPWMNQLVAVSCLSLASKVEEIQSPFLMYFQVKGSKILFEPKTIMRMELIVLSSLKWKMNPVTPFALVDYIMRRLGLMNHHLHLEFLRRCERVFLSVINDSRFMGYLPSVMATATMWLVSKELEPGNASDYLNQLKNLLNISEENIDGCSKFILDALENHGSGHKRKDVSAPGSPSAVMDAYFSSDNSNGSWALASSFPPLPKPPFKKKRAQEQQMRLAPINRVSIGVHGNPH